MKRLAVVLSVIGLLAMAASAQQRQETPEQTNQRLTWWREARFGMFIHWGPVSLKGTEIGWSRGSQVPIEEYDNLYKQFNPTKFNADQWVSIAKSTGMKYIVLTTKHHDGFCMWDTKQTDYNIMNGPFKRDVCKELAEACRKQGIRFCTYHSVTDWHHPAHPYGSPGGQTRKPTADIEAYTQYIRAQVKELITNYGPLGIMWFDVPQGFDRARGQALDDYVYSLQPDIIINNRSGAPGDYDTPEQRIGGFKMDRPWETCMTICRQWSWKPDDQMKSLEQCLRALISCAGGDGNLLFNVGPMPTGEIEPRQVERLKEMGQWMQANGDTIYGTRGGPWKPGKWGASTRKGNTIYLHVMSWPEKGLVLPAIEKRKIISAKVFGGGEATAKLIEAGIAIEVSEAQRRPIDTIVELTMDGPAIDIPAVSVGVASLTTGKKATASNVFRKSGGYAATMAVDGDSESRWATDGGTKSAWLEIDLGKDETFDRAVIDEAFGKRVKSFELQYKAGEDWKTFIKGTTIGPNWEKKFEPVTARIVRLNILDASDGPTINEFELYRPGK